MLQNDTPKLNTNRLIDIIPCIGQRTLGTGFENTPSNGNKINV